MQFESWDQLLAKPKLADIAINTLMDKLHAPSATKALGLGYHMLLEKPMATTLADCIAIDRARRENGRIVSVCHSMRYHLCYTEVKRLLDAGAIGRLVSFDLVEGVEYIHQSHSFVRGNWGNEGRSTFMLLAKSCHDIDLLGYLVGKPCRRVSSFGSLTYFRPENAPPGAPERCTDGCPAEGQCMYSALKVYLPEEAPSWFADHADFRGKPVAEKMEKLKTGPYGRCVYRCDNDVVDHQVVGFEFDGEVTGTFTMTAFDPGGRRLRLHGTEGQIEAEAKTNTVELYRPANKSRIKTVIPFQPGEHGGGDAAVMAGLLRAIRNNDPSQVLTGTAESLRTHAVVFAAEKARREKRVVELSELMDPAKA
jgi:predicted dehydrogenase